jgi:hypothetical protein
MVAAVALVGGGLGWWLGRPTALQPSADLPHFTRVDPNALPPQSTGEDTAPGFEKRNALRTEMDAALDKMELSPCDPVSRKAYFDAYADMNLARMRDEENSSDTDTPPYWRTSQDMLLGGREERLLKAQYVTYDEISVLAVKRVSMGLFGGSNDHLPMPADKCGFTPASVN